MTKKQYFRKLAREQRAADKAAYKARQAKRKAQQPKKPEQPEEEDNKLTHAIARECAQQRGVSIRYMASWLRGSKNRQQLIDESPTAVCPEVLSTSPDMHEFDKNWALLNTLKTIEDSYRSPREVDEVCNIAAMVDLGARDIFGDKAVNNFISSIRRAIDNKPWPQADKDALIDKHKNIFNHE